MQLIGILLLNCIGTLILLLIKSERFNGNRAYYDKNFSAVLITKEAVISPDNEIIIFEKNIYENC